MLKKSFFKIATFVFAIFIIASCSKTKELSTSEKLELFGKSWGALKYHHPEIGLGNINWDSVFIAYAPKIIQTKTDKEFNTQLNTFITIPNHKKLSAVAVKCDASETENLVDFKWLSTTNLSKENSTLLHEIITKKGSYTNVYVSDSVKNRSLDYARFYENPMKNADLTKTEIRLLGLFRYWNIIEYFFPYKNMTDKEWDSVLTAYIPQFINAKNQKEYYECLLKLSTEINDGHANIPFHPDLRKSFFGIYTPGFTAKIIEEQLVVNSIRSDSLAKISGIKIGDIIQTVNNEPTQNKIANLGKYLPSPNKAFHNAEISRYILNGNSNAINLTIVRDASTIELSIPRYTFSDIRKFRDKKPTPVAFKFINENIGYAHMGALAKEHLPDFFKNLNETTGLILDFRHYPNWEVLSAFLQYFYSTNQPFAKLKSQCLNKPGSYFWHTNQKDFSDLEFTTTKYNKPIILLVDEHTLSFGEYFVMAFQVLKNVTVVGSQTAGEDGNQVGIDMPGGMKMFMSSLGIYYPNGDNSQRTGVKIDVVVKQTIPDLKSGNDAVLNYAITKLK